MATNLLFSLSRGVSGGSSGTSTIGRISGVKASGVGSIISSSDGLSPTLTIVNSIQITSSIEINNAKTNSKSNLERVFEKELTTLQGVQLPQLRVFSIAKGRALRESHPLHEAIEFPFPN
jgi:hypothetical protein